MTIAGGYAINENAMMRKALLPILLLPCLLVSFADNSSAFWIWTSKTKTFERPGDQVKAIPPDQLQFALSFFKAKEYDRSLKEMEKLVSKYPLAKEAAEAQYYVGRCHEELENYDDAAKAYGKVVSRYPNSQRIAEVIEREYRIGNLFFSGKKRKIAGLEIIPSFGKAIEIFRQVVEQSPYGPYGVLAQYKLGESYKKAEDYGSAREAFEKLIEEYPESELVDEARYQLALVSLQDSKGVSYDEQTTNEALAQFSRFVKEHPESDLVEESLQAIQLLKDRKAEKAYGIARFYEKQGKADAAKLYYNQVIEQYGSSSWAKLALERLTVLQKESAVR